MTPARWQQIKTLVSQALDLPEDARDAFLDQQCATDPDLRRQVQAFLYPAPDAEAFLADDAVDDPLLGTHIGPYRLTRELGRGGMGRVFYAERDDGVFAQHVAIKLVKRGMDSDEILRRFRYERQILAALEHPNIARLYDGGRTEAGQPYFVMEYVEGLPITDYCDAHRLSVDDRLALFRTVCEAVEHAHRNLVVHRDLKPGNILVTEGGQVKLLDFGIAKLTHPETSGLLTDDPAGVTMPATRTDLRLMTPEYAAPEQLRGEPVTTATDVYQLGIVLYELLTGHRPFATDTEVRAEIERRILHTDPVRPSRAVLAHATSDDPTTRPETGEHLRRRLQGDVDTIVLQALRKEADRRYGSVVALSEDVQRHLTGLPVAARSAGWTYRLGKFVRRQRVPVTLAAVMIVVVAGLVLYYTAELTHERDVARLEAAKASQVTDFMVDLFHLNDPNQAQGDTLTVREAMDRGVARIEAELQGQPEIQATLLHAVGTVYHYLYLFDRAEPLLVRALALREGLPGVPHEALGNTQSALGILKLDQSDYATADSLQHAALATYRTAFGDRPHVRVAEVLKELGRVAYYQGDYEVSKQWTLAAINMGSQLGDANLTSVLNNDLATTLMSLGDLEAAVPYFEAAIALRHAQGDTLHTEVAAMYSNLGHAFRLQQRYEEALPWFTRSLGISRHLHGEEHADVGLGTMSLGALYHNLGRYAEADTLYRETQRIYARVFGPEDFNTAICLFNRGRLAYEQAQYAAAEQHFRTAQRLFADEFWRPYSTVWLGNLLVDDGQLEAARRQLEAGLAGLSTLFPADDWRIAFGREGLAAYHLARGAHAEAEALLLEAYPIIRASRGADSWYTRHLLTRLVALYEAWGNPAEAAHYRALLTS